MTLWAIVPVKPLRRAKSRLASVLNEAELEALNRSLFQRTVETLTRVPEIERVMVISRDPAALSLARVCGARTMQEDGTPGLNVSLQRATAVAKGMGARGLLILPADLPLITKDDIEALLGVAADPPVAVVAPDYRRQGTNALLVNPPDLLDYSFGPGSFERHCTAALDAGAQLITCHLPSLRYDVDIPEDLAFMDAEAKLWVQEQAPEGDCFQIETNGEDNLARGAQAV
jgi:2-phospho-L-lactate guanylyltransferase